MSRTIFSAPLNSIPLPPVSTASGRAAKSNRKARISVILDADAERPLLAVAADSSVSSVMNAALNYTMG